jgi:hypothetical protein
MPQHIDELEKLRGDIDDLEARSVSEAAFQDTSAKDDCTLAVAEVARRLEAQPGTGFAERLRQRARSAVERCLEETVAARCKADDLDGARAALGAEPVKMALGDAWASVHDRLSGPILQAEESWAAELERFKALVTDFLRPLVVDAKHTKISYGDLGSTMRLDAFNKLYSKADKVLPASPLLEKHFPGRVVTLQPRSAPCAACLLDPSTILRVDFVGGRLNQALVVRWGGKAPRAQPLLDRWYDAFVAAVGAALSNRFSYAAVTRADDLRYEASFGPAESDDVPSIVVTMSPERNGTKALRLSLALQGEGHRDYRKLLARIRDSVDAAEASALAAQRPCAHVFVGKRWVAEAGRWRHNCSVVSVDHEASKATVHCIGALTEQDYEFECSEIDK